MNKENRFGGFLNEQNVLFKENKVMEDIRKAFPPLNRAEMDSRGWDMPDFVYVTGDAYVDHPSFGAAVICRVLENAGYRIAVISQPDWHSAEAFTEFGCPRLGFRRTIGILKMYTDQG